MSGMIGRPSLFTQELADTICNRLIDGESLSAICRSEGMPSAAAILRWVGERPDFRELYARAREAQADMHAADVVEIADSVREGKKIKRTQAGYSWLCTCGQEVKWNSNRWEHGDKSQGCTAKPEKVVNYETEETIGDMVERSKLMMDARKWHAARMAPQKYGDRILNEHTGPGGGSLVVEFVRSEKKA